MEDIDFYITTNLVRTPLPLKNVDKVEFEKR